jgi:catechol 2,3-dioxygenase-like lactoylglutathione lyase family enzyme
MSISKAYDLAFIRLRAPDLDVAARFATDFGLIPLQRTARHVYARGTDPGCYIYIVEQGPAKFVGFAFLMKEAADLDRLSRHCGVPIEPLDSGGAGRRVVLTEPNGYQVEAVHGIEPLPALPIARQLTNTAATPLARSGELLRLPKGAPTPVKRIAHVVLATPRVRETISWFQEHFGLITSDHVYAGDEGNIIGSFNRLDRGEEYVDHHVLFCVASPRAGLQHVSFEVPDIDAVLADHHYLKALNRYDHMWGVGRHLLGSQVFDYWSDPWGRAHEHWADSDRLNAAAQPVLWPVHEGFVTQWGDEPPEKFRNCVAP